MNFNDSAASDTSSVGLAQESNVEFELRKRQLSLNEFTVSLCMRPHLRPVRDSG